MLRGHLSSLDSSVLDLENGLACVSCSAWSLRALPQGGMGTDRSDMLSEEVNPALMEFPF